MATGRSIRLFLVDGTSSGLITAEIPNWTGHLLVCPRARLGEALQRDEASKTGVYFLIGDCDGRQRVYVGEGDSIADRVRSHAKDADKDFWEQACLVTNKDLNLTKAHIRYLESRLVQKIEQSGRASLHNDTRPSGGSLPEADISDMEFFLSQLETLLATVGFDFLRPKVVAATVSQGRPIGLGGQLSELGEPRVVRLTLKHESSSVDARAVYQDGETTVLRGSTGTAAVFKVNQYAPLRQQLIDEGRVLVQTDGSIRFVDDVPFRSPSAAAAVLNNRNSAGPREWRVEDTNQTLRDWLDASLD